MLISFILFCVFHFELFSAENFVEDLPDLLAGKMLTAMLSDLLSTSADKGSRRALY